MILKAAECLSFYILLARVVIFMPIRVPIYIEASVKFDPLSVEFLKKHLNWSVHYRRSILPKLHVSWSSCLGGALMSQP